MTKQTSFLGALASHVAQFGFINKLARQSFRNGVSVFMFHRVLPKHEECHHSELNTSKDVFADLLDWLSETFEILPLDVLVKRRNRSSGRKPLCAITFDDGWLDNYVHAFRPLQERNLPATIFLPVRFIGTNRRFWQDRLWLCTRRLEPSPRELLIETAARQFPWFPISNEIWGSEPNLRSFLMTRPSQEVEEFVQCVSESVGAYEGSADRAFLNWDEIRTMHNSGISFGSHTLNHRLLTVLPPAQLYPEIADSKRELQDRLGTEVFSFSYPWGARNPLARDIVKAAGYAFAVGTSPGGLIKAQDDDWMLPRFAISDSVVTRGGQFNSHKAILGFARNVWSATRRRPGRRSYRSSTGKLKIVFVIDQISHWEGGTERQLRTLIQSLDRKYYDPELRFIFRDPNLSDETLPCAAQWICPDPSDIPSPFGRLVRLAQNLRRAEPDVVQGLFVEGIVLGVIAGRLARVPTIVASKRNAGYRGRFHHHLAFRCVAKLAHAWQCNSDSTWNFERSVDEIPLSRLELLPNAIDLTHFQPATPAERASLREKLGLNEQGPVFVLVAALTPVKNIGTLVTAMRQIKTSLPTAELLIVGDGPLRDDLKRLSSELGVSSMIHFVGSQSDVKPYLAAADFGVLTSLSEGSSNSVLEYMAMGLPSVVSNIQPNRELVTGRFFEPGNDKSLAQELLALSSDVELQAKLRRQYTATAQQFSLENFATRTQSYYTRLASERTVGY